MASSNGFIIIQYSHTLKPLRFRIVFRHLLLPQRQKNRHTKVLKSTNTSDNTSEMCTLQLEPNPQENVTANKCIIIILCIWLIASRACCTSIFVDSPESDIVLAYVYTIQVLFN